MSRSNNTDLVNPAKKFFDWSGSEGQVEWYDKDAKEKVAVPLPFRFLVLDRVTQVTGGVDKGDTFVGYWSNAIRNLQTDKLVVRSKGGVVAEGLYADIKGVPGVKFMTGLYIAFYDDDKKLQIGYLRVKGAILGAWIEFSKNKNIYEGGFSITDKEAKKKGSNKYWGPALNVLTNVSEETDEAAKALDRELQEYLKAYFAQQGQNQANANTPERDDAYEGPDDNYRPSDLQDNLVDITDDDDIPF